MFHLFYNNNIYNNNIHYISYYQSLDNIHLRILNAILLSTDKFLIPQIRDTIAMFANCSLFGEFDLSEAYLQFPLHPNSQKYTAFTWNGVQYMFAGVPFGINFIPSHFQRQLLL